MKREGKTTYAFQFDFSYCPLRLAVKTEADHRASGDVGREPVNNSSIRANFSPSNIFHFSFHKRSEYRRRRESNDHYKGKPSIRNWTALVKKEHSHIDSDLSSVVAISRTRTRSPRAFSAVWISSKKLARPLPACAKKHRRRRARLPFHSPLRTA